MFCYKCNKENPNENTFCGYCGASIDSSNSKQPEKKNRISKKYIAIIAAIVFLFSVGVLGFIMVDKNNKAIEAKKIADEKAMKENAKKENDRIEYLKKVKLCSDIINVNGNEAISISQTIVSVWGKAIERDWDFNEVFKYMFSKDLTGHEWSGLGMDRNGFSTISWGSLSENMNSFKDELEKVTPIKDQIDEKMKEMKSPPKELISEYDLLTEYYCTFVELYDCALNPSGNYQNYSSLLEQKRSKFNSTKSKLSIRLN